MAKSIKIGIISSGGGHLFQLLQINVLFRKHIRFWVTFQGNDSSTYLIKEKIYFAHYPESRNMINTVKNFLLALFILRRERPNILISNGAGLAVPFFIVGRFFLKTTLIFIEPYDFVAYPSLTGRILYNFVDLFLVQHQRQKKWFPKAKYWGSLLLFLLLSGQQASSMIGFTPF